MRLINADALKKDFPKDEDWEYPVNTNEYVCERIDAQPTVDSVRHGKWKQWDSYGFDETYECTACGESFVLIEGTPITNGYKYCPNCGAKMDNTDEFK